MGVKPELSAIVDVRPRSETGVGSVGWGPAEREFVRAARAQSTLVRAGLAIVVQAAAVLVTPARNLAPMLVSLVLVTAWVMAITLLLRHQDRPWVLWVDTAVLCALGLLQPVLDVPALVRDDCGWVYLTAEAALIAHQWQFRRAPALVASVLVAGGYCVGSIRMGELPLATTVVTTAWLLVTALVSRWIRASMHMAGRSADQASAAHEQAQRDIEVADALRESEAAHLAMLHDTVAATLMMVGLGASAPGSRLREQAARDLAVLTAATGPSGVGAQDVAQDVAEELARVIDPIAGAGGLRIAFTRIGPAAVLPGPVSEAFAGAVGESLRNVERHAGAGRADVELDTRDGAVQVRIRDDGGGFRPDTRPGRGIRLSITGRMERAGGTAGVSSTPDGVLVELGWPAETPE